MIWLDFQQVHLKKNKSGTAKEKHISIDDEVNHDSNEHDSNVQENIFDIRDVNSLEYDEEILVSNDVSNNVQENIFDIRDVNSLEHDEEILVSNAVSRELHKKRKAFGNSDDTDDVNKSRKVPKLTLRLHEN